MKSLKVHYSPLKHTGVLCAFILIVIGVTLGFVVTQRSNTTQAAVGSDFQAGNIISDSVFYNSTSMTTAQIQGFLETEVTSCDTNGTQSVTYYYNSTTGKVGLYSFSGGSVVTTTRAVYGQRYNAYTGRTDGGVPYVCMANFSQTTPSMAAESGLCNAYTGGTQSAAQIIHDVGIACGINPQVLLDLLQKEQAVITDSWPQGIEYQEATGYACPDSGSCDPAYAGFFNQIYYAARQYRLYQLNASSYNYQSGRNNTILWNPSTSCGSSTVYLSGQATASLYNYTPYRPNQAALNNLYGTGDSCSSYGNRNFWVQFVDWFGSANDPTLYVALIKTADSPALYLQTATGKYYIPSSDVINNWGLGKYAVTTVSTDYLNSLTTGPWVSNLLKDNWNNYFVVENGTLHYVRDLSYLSLWNLQPTNAVQSLGIANSLTSSTWLGRFLQDSSQPSGQIWLMDKGQKHSVSTSMLYAWRYTPDQLTTVSTAFLNSIPTNANVVTAFANNGTSDYVIDSGQKLSFSNSNIENAYYGTQTAVIYDPITLSYLPTLAASQFIVDAGTGQWFMLEADKKHYILTAELAQVWGKTFSTPLTPLSDLFVSSLVDGGNLSYVVQTASPTSYWLIDGIKHHISDASVINAWVPAGQTPPTYSTQSLDLLATGVDASATINAPGSPFYYLMDAGVKHYLMSPSARSGWGTTVMNISGILTNMIPEGSFLGYIARNTDGNAYLLMNNLSYSIDPAYYTEWGVNNGTITLTDSTVSRYTSSGITLRAFISINGVSFTMLNGYKTPISTYADAYQPSTLQQSVLPSDYFPSATEATYLAKSTNPQDNSVYLINAGKKYLLSGFASYVSYGYLSRGVTLTTLTPEALSLIPTGTNNAAGLFIRTASSYGIKFINFGTSLGFPDGDTLSNFLGSTPVLIVSDSVYNSFPLVGSVSRILQDDSGKIYLVENGTKRWITNSNAYDPYRHYPVTYLYGTTMSLIPDGPAIN